MNAIVEKEIKGIYTELHRYEQSEIGLYETIENIKRICEVRNENKRTN